MAFLDLWGAFSIGIIVAAIVFVTFVSFERKFGLFAQDRPDEQSSESAWRNLKAAFNPVTNIVEVFWRPAVKGIGAPKSGGTAYTLERLSEGLEPDPGDVGEGDEVRMRGMDGVRALVFLWALAFQLNEFLALLDGDYKDSTWFKDKDEKLFFWKVAGAGYLGLNGMFVLSGFLFTVANVKLQQEFNSSPEADSADASTKFFSRYVPLVCRRVARLWPSLMAAVLFVGFLFPFYTNSDNSVLRADFFEKCERNWWTNAFFIANFWESECFFETWAVSIIVQLMFLAPLPAYLYAQGDTKRAHAYQLVYSIIVLSLAARFLTVYFFGIEWSPLEDKHSENLFYLSKMPWCRAGEYCVGILVAFSVLDERADEAPTIYDIYKLVGEKFEDWLTESRLLLVTTLQTATLCVGAFFVYEGTLQEDKFDMSMSPVQRTVVLVLGDLVVASFLGLLLRWACSSLHGSWLRALLGNPLLYPLASLSYCGFLFQLSCAYWATEVLSQVYSHDIEPGYLYFSKAYFLTLAFTLCVSTAVTVFIEKPFLKLAEVRE